MTDSEIKEKILTLGCYSSEENLRIYEKWFKKTRKAFRAAKRKFAFENKTLCDIGCSYGSNLIHCSQESFGIEIEKYPAKFAKSIGLNVYQTNIFDDISNLPKADVVWSADTLEHVESPHIFLRKAYNLLNDNGLIILKIPTVPHHKCPVPIIKTYQKGYLYGDHINGFTAATLKFFCERSGFKTVFLGSFLSSYLRLLNLPFIYENLGQIIYVGKKISNWEYPTNSTRTVSNNRNGFLFKGQNFGKLYPKNSGFPGIQDLKIVS